jgi:hypothetical protein
MTNEVINGLSSYLFWDRDIHKLDLMNDKELILERVFSRGMENDEKQVFVMYDIELIKETVLKIKNLDKKTLNYLSIIFRIPKEKFRCYKNIQFQSHY